MLALLLLAAGDGRWPHSPINDEITLLKSLFAYGIIAAMVLVPLILGVMEYRKSPSLVSFIPLAQMLVVIGGVWAWVRHFVEHGGFFLWPLFVAVVILILQIIKAADEQRELNRRREKEGEFPDPPNTGGPANPRHFEKWKKPK